MKKALYLLIAGAILSGVAAYAASANPGENVSVTLAR
jgi:hypothetical protein